VTIDEQCFVVDDQVVTETIGDEMILLDLKGERYLSVDRVGQQVWALLNGENSVRSVVDVLGSTYQVDPAVLRNDVDSFLAKLINLGLVRVAA